MRPAIIIFLALCLPLIPGHIFSAARLDLSGTNNTFLDLPDGFGISEEVEDAPEVIEFYSDEYEGDAWFFCLDHSDSMRENSANGQPKWVVRNRETIEAIMRMSSRSVACILFYDHRKEQSPCLGDPPIKMDAAGKARAIAFVSSHDTAGDPSPDSCIAAGMIRILKIASKTKNEYRTCLLVADGRAQCKGDVTEPDQVFQKIMAHNFLKIPINTIYTGSTDPDNPDWQFGASLLRRLAQATGGKFKVAL